MHNRSTIRKFFRENILLHSFIISEKEMSIIECKYPDKISILKSTVIKYLASQIPLSLAMFAVPSVVCQIFI